MYLAVTQSETTQPWTVAYAEDTGRVVLSSPSAELVIVMTPDEASQLRALLAGPWGSRPRPRR